MKKIITLRIIALMIDSIFISIFISIVSPWLKQPSYLGSFDLFGKTWAITFQLYFVFLFVYLLLFDMFNKGVTIGKAIMHIKIVSERTELLPDKKTQFKRSVIKAIATSIPFISLIYYLIKHKTIQDVFAKTITIYSASLSQTDREKQAV